MGWFNHQQDPNCNLVTPNFGFDIFIPFTPKLGKKETHLTQYVYNFHWVVSTKNMLLVGLFEVAFWKSWDCSFKVYSKICDVCFSDVVADSHRPMLQDIQDDYVHQKENWPGIFQDPKDKLLKKKQPTATYDNYCD